MSESFDIVWHGMTDIYLNKKAYIVDGMGWDV